MREPGRPLQETAGDTDLDWGDSTPVQTGSGFDTALRDLGAAERRAEAERRMRHRAACEFLATFYRSDVENAKALKDHGVATSFAGNRIAFAKSGRPAEVMLVATQQGELAALFAPGGRRDLMQRTDVGEFDPMIKTALRKQMIRLVIGYLGIGA